MKKYEKDPFVTQSNSVKKPTRTRDSSKTRLELELAFQKIKTSGMKMSVQAVAVEAGVHYSLISKWYKDIHRDILKEMGRLPSQLVEAKKEELEDLRRIHKDVKEERDILQRQMVDLVSVNLTQEEQLKELKDLLVKKIDNTKIDKVTEERDELLAENRELKVWVAELRAELEGKLIGRIGPERIDSASKIRE